MVRIDFIELNNFFIHISLYILKLRSNCKIINCNFYLLSFSLFITIFFIIFGYFFQHGTLYKIS
jgi:hypothetical protein